MNDQLVIDIQNRIREVEALDELFIEIDIEIYDESEEWR